MAVGEVLEPWESAEVGVDVVMYHLEAARTIAHHGEIYRTNAESKLQGKTFIFISILNFNFCFQCAPMADRPGEWSKNIVFFCFYKSF